MPSDALEVLDVLDDELVARHDDVERGLLRVDQLRVPELTQHLTILRVAPVGHHLVVKYNNNSISRHVQSLQNNVLVLQL